VTHLPPGAGDLVTAGHLVALADQLPGQHLTGWPGPDRDDIESPGSTLRTTPGGSSFACLSLGGRVEEWAGPGWGPPTGSYLGGNCEWGTGAARLAVGALWMKPITAQSMSTPAEP